MSKPTNYTIRYYDSYSTAPVSLYPMVTSSSDPKDRIWNGREVSGYKWRQFDGQGQVVDLSKDCDGKLTSGQQYYLAADVVAGHSPWLSSCIFTYDPNSTNVANIQWSGSAINCGASFNGITTWPVIYDPDVVGQKREMQAGNVEYGEAKGERKGERQGEQMREGQKTSGVAV